jgi:formylglycine-generating enzyme required for sulfatase activity
LFDEMKKFLSFFALLTAASAAHAHDLTWVKVGDAGNAPDKTGHGAVAYEFQITKHEITVFQYAEFLNAVAAKADPRAVWNAAQKIVRTGNPGAFKYAASPKREREPVMQVSFLDAMRFANWLHHGGGSGDTETGAYLISKDGGLASREAGARIWIPNENEWYKAAYYQPQATGGPPGNYWRYPTRSDVAPKLAKPGDPGLNLANFLADTRPQPSGGILRGFNDVMPVGSFPGSASHYGTLDQAGNAWEWIETTVFDTQRIIRGGSMCGSHEKLLSTVRTSTSPAKRYPDTGFRLARAMPKAGHTPNLQPTPPKQP